jgi:hypothetical protein
MKSISVVWHLMCHGIFGRNADIFGVRVFDGCRMPQIPADLAFQNCGISKMPAFDRCRISEMPAFWHLRCQNAGRFEILVK